MRGRHWVRNWQNARAPGRVAYWNAMPRLRACAALWLVPCQIAVQQKEGRQALLAVQRVQRRCLLAAVLLVHHVAKDEVKGEGSCHRCPALRKGRQ